MVMRLGLIGRGKWGRNIERTLLSFPDVSVVAIGRGEPLHRDVDGVLIATPSVTHADLASPYIEAGIAVFIEKPMATSVEDAKRIQDAAIRSRSPVFVGHIHLHNPAFVALQAMLPRLGAVRYVLCESANGSPRTDSSLLWDWLPHDLSRAHALFGGDPASVQAWSLSGSQSCQTAIARYRYGAASLVSMMSWLSPVRRQSMTITAEQGIVVFDDKAERKLVVHDEAGNASYPDYQEELPLTRELRAFLDVVRHGTADVSQVALGVAIAKAIEAADRSIAGDGAQIDIRDA
jgi:UDP-N-acetylglucosamine 3-dehydrogenase